MNEKLATLCIAALRRILTFDGVIAARDAGTLDPATGKVSIPVEVLKGIVANYGRNISTRPTTTHATSSKPNT